ncbi:hypothetical protein W822_16100 [Advenella kashmirensis W13003]|uniref:Uncharacterized protein n=2 Tax=Advenella kashmirensis TaxID=310575 RepID=V8QSX4_9BURK|nr:hypothetical protein W822_16100 [Advenella kashmirensis W13003]
MDTRWQWPVFTDPCRQRDQIHVNSVMSIAYAVTSLLRRSLANAVKTGAEAA